MSTPKASGPLWADTVCGVTGLSPNHVCAYEHEDGESIPCRLVPGHGKVVPVELVEEVLEALAIPMEPSLSPHTVRDIANHQRDVLNEVRAAIRAALEGAV